MDAIAIENAGETVFDQVYVPAFLQKCASRGVTFRSEDELRTALQSTGMLLANQEKQASEVSTDLHKSANVALRRLFGEDVEAAEKSAQDDHEANALAQQIVQDEGVKQAVSLLSTLSDKT